MKFSVSCSWNSEDLAIRRLSLSRLHPQDWWLYWFILQIFSILPTVFSLTCSSFNFVCAKEGILRFANDTHLHEKYIESTHSSLHSSHSGEPIFPVVCLCLLTLLWPVKVFYNHPYLIFRRFTYHVSVFSFSDDYCVLHPFSALYSCLYEINALLLRHVSELLLEASSKRDSVSR